MKKDKNMEDLIILLAGYGITFGLQQKAEFLRGKNKYLDKMLDCTYCTGFHSGYLAYGLKKGAELAQTGKLNASLVEGITYAFAGSAFSYLADSAGRVMESHSEPIDIDEGEDE
tara:strand:- start:1845 stop:2186 length:342 start_codon:yes stop_codon:yes gene_type:complete